MIDIPEDLECPHCEYKYDDGCTISTKRSKEGPFFVLPIEAVQRHPFNTTWSAPVYFCPKCGFCFIQTRK